MKKLYHLLAILSLLIGGGQFSLAQTGVLDPNDPIVVYNPSSPPATPSYGTLAKWVKTNRVNWNSSSYKAYYYNGMVFRLKFPKTYQHGVSDGKKYPLIIFFHGIGEKGTIYDNEYQLYHGGELHRNKVDDGSFDGFLLYPQNTSGFFGNNYYDNIVDLINTHLIPEVKVDPFRIMVEGLSGGGGSTWDFMIRHPKVAAAIGPISAANSLLKNYIQTYKFIPIWWFQGGADTNPAPGIAQDVYNAVVAAGGNIKLTIYAGQGHGVWGNAWGESDFFPFMKRAHKANPWPLFGRTEFCPGDPINVTLGLTAGFDQYEWRKDGDLIATATGNTLTVTATGIYDARVRSGNTWSEWSPLPVQIKIKTPTVSPNIEISGLMSSVLPTPEGKDSVVLAVPAGYTSYLWKKTTDATTLSTSRTFTAREAGEYIVKVTEQFGCSSEFSPPFKVVAASGSNAPDAASGLVSSSISKTEILLNWSDKPNPVHNETQFEIYRATSPGGAYKLAGKVNADVLTFTDSGLNPNTRYYYIVRAVNNNGAAPVSNETNALTQVDSQPPTAPGNLQVTTTSRTSVTLSWTSSSDDVGVDRYDIFINGTKSFTISGSQTTFTAFGLTERNAYTFVVKARDVTGNLSPASNQVTGTTLFSGLNYKYFTGSWDLLPDFNALVPAKTGTTARVDISPRTQSENYGFLWEGFIRIPVSGNYTFETYSDDGSKLYIGNYSHSATPLVNNDGLHGSVYKEGTINLTAGVHPIAVTFFQKGGGAEMKLFWKNTAHGVNNRQEIPASFFADTLTLPGTAPIAPGNILATAVSYNKVNLTWNDNSNNETGFEIYRATGLNNPYTIIGTTVSNATSYTDSALVPQTTYYYQVKAINQYGNSGFNMAEMGGLQYEYYEFGSITTLPDFNTITPVKSGNVPNVTLNVRNRDANYAIKFAGSINIPVAGQYTFYTASDDGSKLYIDEFSEANLVVNNNFLQGTTERSGNITLSAGRHALYVTYFQQGGGQTLNIRYRGPAGSGIPSKIDIPSSALENPNIKATTLSLPPAPTAPSVLTATAASSNAIDLKWNDNSADEEFFEIYRSANGNQNYLLLATIAANDSATVVYKDSALFANATYYYKVRAKNVGGISSYSNEADAITLNNSPVMDNLPNRTMRFGTQWTMNVSAADPDQEIPAFSAVNLPSFGTLSDNGDGTASIIFSPSVAEQGVYSNIQVTATDQHGGTITRSFTLTVNDNYAPVLNSVSNVSLAEKASTTLNLSASDQNEGDVLTWSATGLPSFAILSSSNRTAEIVVSPTYTDAGTYNVNLQVEDGNGSIDTKNFTITVTDVNPNFKLYVNFTDGVYKANAPWNNTNKKPALNDVFPNLLNDAGVNTGIAIKIMTPWQTVNGGANTNNQGAYTGNNSGVYPDFVMVSNYWTNTVKQTFKLTGLDTNYLYTFTFFGSRAGISDNRIANYTIGDSSAILNGTNNSTNTVNISNIRANSLGEISIDLQAATGSQYAYLNAMVINASYDDGNPPAVPGQLTARSVSGGIRLNWLDRATNETGYEVHRGMAETGPYQLLATTPANDTAYTDTNVAAGNNYYYMVRGTSSHGNSAFSDAVSFSIANQAPVLAAIGNVAMKTDAVQPVAISATDDAGDIITLTATGLPGFASLQINSNGSGTITLSPSGSDIGTYQVTVKATDDKNASSSRSFTIQVSDKNITSIYVNANQVEPANTPWNNFNALPTANRTISNLVDESNTATSVSITIVDALTGANNVGTVTGNNSGVYPDDVMKTFFYDQSNSAKRIRISGLSATRKYNLVFFGSRTDVSDNRNTIYAVGAQAVTLNAASNTSNTVQINGLSPDGSGSIEFTIRQATGSFAAYLNALVIQSYVESNIPLTPASLTATGKSRSSVQLAWADKSSNETGFEISRALSPDGTYSVVTTTGANATGYSDNNLSANTLYYYKVRAVANGNYSGYTNIAVGGTMSYGVNINFNTVNPAPAPWNNTNSLPFTGQVLGNIKDDAGNITGLSMELIENFTGTNPAGAQTGNNSGVYIDRVIAESYYVEPGDTARMKFAGLDQSKVYTFTFFGSRANGGVRISAYRINGRVVTLEANNNTSNTVQIDNVEPDQNGEVVIEVYVYANYGYLNALVINAFPRDNGEQPASTLNGGFISTLRSADANATKVAVSAGKANDRKSAGDEVALSVQKVYPNPFRTFFYVAFEQSAASTRVMLMLYDLQGRLILSKDLGTRSSGTYLEKVDLGNRQLVNGLYLLQINADAKPIKTIKLIKN